MRYKLLHPLLEQCLNSRVHIEFDERTIVGHSLAFSKEKSGRRQNIMEKDRFL